MSSAKSVPKDEQCLRNLESSKEVVGGEFLAWDGLMAGGESQMSKGTVGNSGACQLREWPWCSFQSSTFIPLSFL